MKLNMTRRGFVEHCTAASAAGLLSAWSTRLAADERPKTDWRTALQDPVYGMISGQPDLDRILALFPRTVGKPAFDPQVIAENIKRLQPVPRVNTGHPFLDLSVKTALAYIEATFRGNHPKYGVGTYAQDVHDGFPPTIIAAVDALSAWGMGRRAAELFGYWLAKFVKQDGTIKYYGPSISEYGQLLHTAALLDERAGTADWWAEGHKALDRMAEFLLQLQAAAAKEGKLIAGVPEADTRKDVARYFHNNAWAAKGLQRWAELCERQKASPTTTIATVKKASAALAKATLGAVLKAWPVDPADWWLPPQIEPVPRPASLTATTLASYTNYRYWPELLSSGLLPTELANRVVEARLRAGGQFCGMTRFEGHLDDWPLANYLEGLWSIGRKRDFLISLYGHVAYHQAEGHLTAYEQVSFPPGQQKADYCLPCQLVAARAARQLQK
jgi:hypothetical protein